MEETDSELLVRYRSGQVDALEQLVNKYRRPLFGFILNMSRRGQDADEIFQEVWTRVIKKLGMYREKNFAGWLMRVAHNIMVDRLRSRKQAWSLDEEKEDGQSLLQAVPGNDPGAGRQMEANELGKHIEEAVAQLPEEQKAVFLMRAQADLSFKEIADIQGVSINTALARMQYALAKLRVALREDYREFAGDDHELR